MRQALLLAIALTSCAVPNPTPTGPVPASTMRVNCIDGAKVPPPVRVRRSRARDTGGEDSDHMHNDQMLAAYLDDFFTPRPDLHGEPAELVITGLNLTHGGPPPLLARHPALNVAR